MNGTVKAANKKYQEECTFGYRTSVRISTGAIPFSLVYGMEIVLPFEVEIPSLRVLTETQLEEADKVQTRFDQLNLIEEKRLTVACHGQLYQQRMKKAFDKKVHPRKFQESELVLKKEILSIQKDHKGKWTPNYEGLYVVKKAFGGGALILTRMDGEELPLPVNSDAVKNSMHNDSMIGNAFKVELTLLYYALFNNYFFFELPPENNKHHRQVHGV
ncbi:uncharacterized protein LOC108336698 [Vigna angularis]|uniref:uncharacterized protein LOC108336698 n=1 Tax=Phaseolus angularis TaxID=3914 RepID=UPI000809A330|nr:uncharacterized protein LOC108336698 [Vigna angularis]